MHLSEASLQMTASCIDDKEMVLYLLYAVQHTMEAIPLH